MAKQRLDAIVIGGGPNGLVAAAYLQKGGRQVLLLEREEQVGGILRATSPAPGFTAPGLVHTVGRLRASVRKDLKLDRYGYRTVSSAARMHAPMPDGSAVTFWDDAAKTAQGIAARNAHDADAYETFDKKVRAIASFLAYVTVATPPDPKSPSLADAIMGLKLGKAFRDLGGRTGREAVRALPMAVADLVQEVFEDAARSRPAASCTRRWGRGRPARRRCSCTTPPGPTGARRARRRSRWAGPARWPTCSPRRRPRSACRSGLRPRWPRS
jgi:phytoene dehydrogenase-like protein